MQGRLLYHAIFFSSMLFTAPAIAGENNGTGSPAQFMQNKGQITDQHGIIRKDIDAKVEANGVTMFVGNGEIHYQWQAPLYLSPKGRGLNTPNSQTTTGIPSPPLGGGREGLIYRMDVKIVGANKDAEIIFEEPTGYYENYYLAHTGESGVTAKGYDRIIYKNIYPDIDLVFYAPPAPLKGSDISDEGPISNIEYQTSNIKYDFIIHPGGNPADIKLRYEGATELKLVDGALVAETPLGSISEDAPYSYEQATGRVITTRYILNGNELRFYTASYNGGLVIDPALKWGTYYGSNNACNSRSATTDMIGNPIVCGQTEGSSNIATTGAHQVSYVDSGDGFVTKFDTAGQRLWSTYYGGRSADRIQDIATDYLGNIYFTGGTASDTGIATAGSFQDTIGRGSGPLKGDAFIVKLNAAGMRQWATYFGDTSGEEGHSVACDRAGNIYVGGSYGSWKSIATPGAFQLSPSSSGSSYHINRGFIAKFNPGGGRIWATHYNGSPVDIAIDPYYNVYIAGFTNDTANIASPGAFQTVCNYCPSNANNPAGFFARFDSSGNRIWGSYYNNSALINSIMYDSRGDIYIAGYAYSSLTGIATIAAHQATGGGVEDAYIAKFSASGSRLWATFYGGTQWDFATGLAVDDRDNVYMIGWTGSSTAIATGGSHKPNFGGTDDMFMAMFNTNGQRQYGTYYGGTGQDWYDYTSFPSLNGVTAYKEGRIYFGSFTRSSTGIATSGTYRSNILGTGNVYLVQFLTDTLVYIKQPYTDTALCIGDTLKLQYGTMQKFRNNNSFTVQLSNSSGSFSSPTTIGTAATNAGGIINCPIPNVTAGAGYRVRIIATAPADTSNDNLKDIRIYPKPANFTAGSNSPLCSGDTLQLNSGSTTSGVVYAWSGPGGFGSMAEDTIIANTTVAHSGNYYITADNNGCMVKDTVSVAINQTPQNVTAGNNGPLCTGDTLQLTSSSSTSGVSYAWTGPNNYNTQNVTRPNAQLPDAGTYKVTVTLGSCSDTATTAVVVNQSPTINIVPTTPTTICAGDTAQFLAFPNNAGTNPQLQWTKNGVDIAGATGTTLKISNLNNGDVIAAQVTAATACPGTKESNKITMTVQPIFTPTVSITADKMPPWNGGLTVTFTATPSHGGSSPTYQWKRAGQDVTGATGSTWGVVVNALNDKDDICVVLKSSYECAQPDTAMSNCLTAAFTGIGGIVHNKNIMIYPNPTTGAINIEMPQRGNYTIRIMNMLGTTVYEGNITGGQKAIIQLNNNLPPGNYTLHLSGDALRHVERITLVK